MPPHTISPSPSWQGLGISNSTLSPPPAGQTQSQQFTGMNLIPRNQSMPFPQNTSPSRALPQQPTSNHPPRQPAFALRPTHTRQPSNKGFTSFSAIPPSPAGPRPTSTPNTPARVPRPPAAESISSRGTITPIPSPIPEMRRNGSTTSTSTNASGSKSARRSKSTEFMRKFSKNETVSGGQYVPLSGLDDQHGYDQAYDGVDERYVEETHSEGTPRAATSVFDYPEGLASTLAQASPPSSPERPHSRSTTYSSHGALSQSNMPTSSSDLHLHNYNASNFPLPPSHPHQPIRSLTTLSDPIYSTRPQIPLGHTMPRSYSQPIHLQSVPERRESGLSNSSYNPNPYPETKRISDLSTGIHSKNAALLSAESGGMMLAFSPSGDGVWRAGEMICGAGTGLIPTPQSIPSDTMGRDQYDPPPPQQQRSTSALSQSHQYIKPNTNIHRRPTHRGRSLSEGENLNRSGTLFHPNSTSQRASRELGVMLGNKSRKSGADQILPLESSELGEVEKVRLEVSKKRKARVEVDVVLERECVVEGGEVRGRMEIRVTGGKRGEGLWVGGGKVRVVGFEEISPTSRHIFYHHPHPLPLFSPTNQTRHSLFASPANSESYHLAQPGSHSIPFAFRLPLGSGAKGSYTSPSQRGPSVRYVVVASLKIHIPETGKRSIAHFYRSVVVLPYLNPGVVLAPSEEKVEAMVEKGLGWRLGGEKGKVEMRVGMGRRVWVSGQRAWFEVEIRNDSSRKIKSLNLAVLQTVQTFNPQPLLDTTDIQARLRLHKRRSQPNLNLDTEHDGDADACQTSTQRRKVSEEVLEADFSDRGAGRVTGKGWWTGLEGGESGRWDLSLLIPNGMISIRRTRLIEVTYTLRVTVNNSIYVDLPITLINFLSIDPPPMPGDAAILHPTQSIRNQAVYHLPENSHYQYPLNVKIDPYGRPLPHRMMSTESLSTNGNAAKASSTTLHLDALITAGRARAEEARLSGSSSGVPNEVTRPISLGSTYTVDQLRSQRYSHTRSQSQGSSIKHPLPQPPTRPKGARIMSYLSTRSDTTSALTVSPELDGDEAEEEAMIAARRAQGRQKSLAALERALDRVKAEDMEDILSPTREVEEGEYFPKGTPEEEVFGLGADTPSRRSSEVTGIIPTPTIGAVENRASLGAEAETEQDLVQGEDAEREQSVKTSDSKIVDDLVAHHGEQQFDAQPSSEEGQIDETEVFGQPPGTPMFDSGGYDYTDELEQEDESNGYLEPPRRSSSPRRISLPRHLPQIDVDPRLSFSAFEKSREGSVSRSAHIGSTRTVYGSFASEGGESEVGMVVEAVRRNMSVKVPSRLLPLGNVGHEREVEEQEGGRRRSERGEFGVVKSSDGLLSVGGHGRGAAQGSRRSSHTPIPTLHASLNSRGGHQQSRRGSAPSLHPGAQGMRRESTHPPIPSPLRPSLQIHRDEDDAEEDEEDSTPLAEMQKKPGFTFATPGMPLRIRNPVRVASPGVSPRTAPDPFLGPSPRGQDMARLPSVSSMLRNEVPLTSPGVESEDAETDNEVENGGIPGLAPSIASDSASSDGHALDSPPVSSTFPPSISISDTLSPTTGRSLPKIPTVRPPSDEVPNFNFQTYQINATKPTEPNWTPPEHMLRAQISLARLRTSIDYQPENDYAHSPSSRPVPEFGVATSTSTHSRGYGVYSESVEGGGNGSRPSSPGHSSSNHSVGMLPGMREKIAKLESRDEALRKFSVSGAVVSPISPSRNGSASIGVLGSGIGASPVRMTNDIAAPSTTSPTTRKSYSKALAPRPSRSASDDAGLGGTTYIRPRGYGHGERQSFYSQTSLCEADGDAYVDPFGMGGRSSGRLERKESGRSDFNGEMDVTSSRVVVYGRDWQGGVEEGDEDDSEGLL